MQPRTPLLLALVGSALAAYAAWLGRAESGTFELICTVIIAFGAMGSVLASATGSLRWQRGIAGGLLLVMAGIILSNLQGLHLLSLNPFPDPRYASFLVGLLVLVVAGLSRGWFVARWLAIALAGGGVLSSGLNLAPFALLPCDYTWQLGIGLSGSMLILSNLLGSKQRDYFEQHAAPLWASRDPLLRSIRLTVLAFMAAIPLLLVYTWMQPIVPETATYALPLALFLSVAIGLSIAGRVIGAIALVIGGVSLLLQSGFTIVLARESLDPAHVDIALYYATFWVPAGLTALYCGARMSAPLLRLLSSPSRPS